MSDIDLPRSLSDRGPKSPLVCCPSGKPFQAISRVWMWVAMGKRVSPQSTIVSESWRVEIVPPLGKNDQKSPHVIEVTKYVTWQKTF